MTEQRVSQVKLADLMGVPRRQITQNTELNPPDEIRPTSTIEKLCRIKREQTEKPNPFTRPHQFEGGVFN